MQGLGPVPYILRQLDVLLGKSCLALRMERRTCRVKHFLVIRSYLLRQQR